jgi:medium-chain acyl-[acyl-carrier-protein] hydrolase
MQPNPQPSPFLLRFQPRPDARLRLVCFAHAGGSASTFAGFGRALPPEVEVVCVQLPGRESRRDEPAVLEMRELVRQLAPELKGLQDRPYALLGYSLGTLIAFECTRELRRMDGRPPLQLLVSAARPPHRQIHSAISQLPRDEFVRIISERYDGIPRPVLDDPDLLDYFLPPLIGDIRLLESYRYEEDAPLDCPIHAFGGDSDPRVSEAELRGWAQHTTGPFSAQLFPGGHFFLQTARAAYLQAIAQMLLQS